jgi:sodium/proline symporter
MLRTEIFTFIVYFTILILFGIFSYHRQKSDTDFVIGDRSLNFWLTALSAHASDMSNWLFMGYPALIFTTGIFGAWAAIGLVIFMFLNWHFLAPKIRVMSEKTNSITLNAYFENRFRDKSATIRVLSSAISFIFFVFYISAGLIGLGFLVESLFGISYFTGITIGLLIVAAYVFIGGYLTVAWIDLFQGFFLLAVIVFIPLYLLHDIGGFAIIKDAILEKKLSTSIFPSFSSKELINGIFLAAGWGLGYFGQPQIITKFMGIKKVNDMSKAKYLGISWQFLALGGATLIGAIGIAIFPEGLSNPELISIEIVKTKLSPLFSGLILCAILAATTNVIAAQLLVVASSLSEDFYKRLINQQATHKQILKVSKVSVIFVASIAYIIAFFKLSTIYKLVLFSWTGIGASFGPLLLISLYYKKTTKLGAILGLSTGALTSAIWPLLNLQTPAMIPAFIISSFSIFLFSNLSHQKRKV